MVDIPASNQPDHDLAAELALDLLTGREKADALRLQLSDPLFAQEVAAWRQRLAPLFAEFPSVPVPETIWDATVERIGASPKAGGDRHSAPKSHLRIWRSLAIAASLVAASLAFMLVKAPVSQPPVPEAPQKLAVASLTGDAKGQIVTIAYDPSTGTLRIASAGVNFGKTVPELWVIPADGKPRSLAVRAAGTSRLAVRKDHRPFMTAGTTLAVTTENPSTAPHDAPGAAPILVGTIAIL